MRSRLGADMEWQWNVSLYSTWCIQEKLKPLNAGGGHTIRWQLFQHYIQGTNYGSLINYALEIHLFYHVPPHTECSRRVISSSYREGPGLKSRSRVHLFLTEAFRDIHQCSQANSRRVPQVNWRSHSSTCSTTHHSLIILPVYTVWQWSRIWQFSEVWELLTDMPSTQLCCKNEVD